MSELAVNDDEADFYGKHYWFNHQEQDLGFANIYSRARSDLSERNLHWLKALLKYHLPPASVVEVGCGPGSFVALMCQAGYSATGVELSPWVVNFGRQAFGVPIEVGPMEALNFAAGSQDVIGLMDVLEHLPDPIATLSHCLGLLKPDGVLLIQTPQFREGMQYEALVESGHAFLGVLTAKEHLYLFSERSVTEFFHRFGAEHIRFEPAIFAQYDMFLAVSGRPLVENSLEEIASALLATPNGRLTLACLDLRQRELALQKQLADSDSDRAARLEQIETLTKQLGESELDRAARLEQIETLTKQLGESELDRAARLEQIETLTKQLGESELDRAARLEQIETLTKQLGESELDRAARLEQIETLTKQLGESELDRAARLEQIEKLTKMIRESS